MVGGGKTKDMKDGSSKRSKMKVGYQSTSSSKKPEEGETDSAALQPKRSKKEAEENSLMIRNDDDNKKGGRFDTSNKPQFHKNHPAPQDQSSKVVLDERFSSVLTDPRFQVDVKRDKYGRKKSNKKKKNQEELAKKELSAFYTVEEENGDDEKPKANEKKNDSKQQHQEDDDDDDDDSSSPSSSLNSDEDDDDENENKDGKRKDDPANDDDDHDDDDDNNKDPMSRIAYLTALSRGEIDVSSSSSDDESDDGEDSDDASSDDNDDDDDEGENENLAVVMGKAGVLDPSSRQVVEEEVQVTTEPSPFLAVMDMDWSNIRAVDLFAIVASFTPPGAVKRVRVYPSDFGMAKMKKEEEMGPSGLWKNKTKDPHNDFQQEDIVNVDDSANDSENGQDYDSEQDGDEDVDDMYASSLPQNDHLESDFDPEQLRAYEASRLKYYFAIVELASPEHADIAYKEVDGMEFEHSSAALDVRSIPTNEISSIVQDRPLRDEASSIPSNYVPPDFVVSALQQTNVQCTWEAGDRDRERALTKYASSGQDWKTAAENDDLKAYLASDASSDEEEDDDNGRGGGGGSKEAKAARIRKMLGLDSDDEGAIDGNMKNNPNEESGSSSDSDNDEADFDASGEGSGEEAVEGEKQLKFIPGEEKLQDKIRSKLAKATDAPKELTPWEKYQEKRKDKRRAKRQEAKDKRKEINQIRKGGYKKRRNDDEFFMGSDNEQEDDAMDARRAKEELELLVAGDDNEEEERDYDMRGLQRIEKNKDKKLRGARKRKEAALAATVGGTEFEVNVRDDRFRAVLDGQDDRFGIDKTDPSYKDTSAMRDILEEQSKRRKQKQRKKAKTTSADDISAAAPPDANAEDMKTSSGASALSFLVSRLKSKVSS